MRPEVMEFAMAVVNAPVVRKSLAEFFPEAAISYREAKVPEMPEDTTRWLKGGPFADMVPVNPNPVPGQGPPEWVRREGSFRLQSTAKRHNPGGKVTRVLADVVGMGDPGYLATSKMAVEIGLGLASSKSSGQDKDGDGGFLTPYVALKEELLDRLAYAGVLVAGPFDEDFEAAAGW